MTAPQTREPVTDWLFVVLRRMTRWASSGITTSQPGNASAGCANPVVLVKFILFFLLIVLMPLFLLPMILVRMVRFGPHAMRFSAAQTVPVDYQASAPELTAVKVRGHQEVCVRVLAAVIRAGAGALADSAAATSLTSGFASLGKSFLAEAGDGTEQYVSWVGSDGHYALTFVRPAGAQTDPAAALADRTCTTCGATYRSELATACEHCGTARPMPWGQWRLASAEPAG